MKTLLISFSLLICWSITSTAQTTWQAGNLVSQYWPNNDVKSYGAKLYVASNDGLFVSSDNGNTWSSLTSNENTIKDVAEIQFTNNGGIFLRITSFGVCSSLDGGTSWIIDTAGVGDSYGADLLYYDANSDRVFYGTGYNLYALYYKSPSDAAWTKVSNLPSGLNNFSPVQMTRVANKLILIDIYRRVLESTDNGITWTQKSSTGLVSAESQVGPSRLLSIGNDLFYGIGGVFKSSDEGATWTKIDQGFASSDTRSLYYDGSSLYSSTYSGRKTYKSTDLGVTWTEFGGTGEWFFKAITNHNGALFGVIHSKDSIYVYGSISSSTDLKNINDIVAIYPNPVNDFLTINNLTNGSLLKIKDITGKIIVSSLVINEKTIINTENFNNGVYILCIEDNRKTYNKKFIVNK